MSDNNSDETPETYYRRRGAGDGSVPPVPPLPPMPPLPTPEANEEAESRDEESPSQPASDPSPWAPRFSQTDEFAPWTPPAPFSVADVSDASVETDIESTTRSSRLRIRQDSADLPSPEDIDETIYARRTAAVDANEVSAPPASLNEGEDDFDDTTISVRQVVDDSVSSKSIDTPLPPADLSMKSTGWSNHAVVADSPSHGDSEEPRESVAEKHLPHGAQATPTTALPGGYRATPPARYPAHSQPSVVTQSASTAAANSWSAQPQAQAPWQSTREIDPLSAEPKKKRSRAALFTGVAVLVVAALVGVLFATGILPPGGNGQDSAATPAPSSANTEASPTPTPQQPSSDYPLGQEIGEKTKPAWSVTPTTGWADTTKAGADWITVDNAALGCQVFARTRGSGSASGIGSTLKDAPQLDALLQKDNFPIFKKDPNAVVAQIGEPTIQILPTIAGQDAEFVRLEYGISAAGDEKLTYLFYARVWEGIDAVQFVRVVCPGAPGETLDPVMEKQILSMLSVVLPK